MNLSYNRSLCVRLCHNGQSNVGNAKISASQTLQIQRTWRIHTYMHTYLLDTDAEPNCLIVVIQVTLLQLTEY
jgi:hypothetical protein